MEGDGVFGPRCLVFGRAQGDGVDSVGTQRSRADGLMVGSAAGREWLEWWGGKLEIWSGGAG